MKSSGFSLIELIITLVLGSIILGIAVAGFRNSIANNQVESIRAEFSGALRLARSEAMKRKVPVTVCPSANATQTACGASTDWTNGWIVFVDSDGNGVLAAASDRIRVREALPNYATFSNNAPIIYTSTGALNGGAVTMTLTPSHCSGNGVFQFNVNASGILSTQRQACP